MNLMSEPLLNPKELAALLRKSRSYIFAMKSRGFIMPGGTATLTEARVWLSRNRLHAQKMRARDSARLYGTPRPWTPRTKAATWQRVRPHQRQAQLPARHQMGC